MLLILGVLLIVFFDVVWECMKNCFELNVYWCFDMVFVENFWYNVGYYYMVFVLGVFVLYEVLWFVCVEMFESCFVCYLCCLLVF